MQSRYRVNEISLNSAGTSVLRFQQPRLETSSGILAQKVELAISVPESYLLRPICFCSIEVQTKLTHLLEVHHHLYVECKTHRHPLTIQNPSQLGLLAGTIFQYLFMPSPPTLGPILYSPFP